MNVISQATLLVLQVNTDIRWMQWMAKLSNKWTKVVHFFMYSGIPIHLLLGHTLFGSSQLLS